MKVRSLLFMAAICALVPGFAANAKEDTVTTSQPATISTEVPLIPLDVLLGNPDKVAPKLSPDGKFLTYVAPLDGVLNVWIRTVGQQDDRPLTRDTGRGVWTYHWAFNGEQVVYTQDKDGDENHRIYAVSALTGETLELTPQDPAIPHPVQAQVIAAIPERPDEILVGLNKRDQRVHDVYLLNLRSGELTLQQESDVTVFGWLPDHNLELRGYMDSTPDGGSVIYARPDASGDFKEVARFSQEDFMGSFPIGFAGDNRRLFLRDSRGRNSAALVSLDVVSGELKELASDSQYDVSTVSTHPTTHEIQAVNFNRERSEWEVLDPSVAADFDAIRAHRDGDFGLISGTLDDQTWLVAYTEDDGPVEYHVYNRANQQFEFLFVHRQRLLGQPLVEMQPISYQASDGLTIHGYLTLPQDWQGPGPLVLNVHGGPWGRDNWGFHPEAQWLANRGYAHLQVNFRGSAGYGKDFINAGDREWGGDMQQDLTDAVAWAVNEGIADPKKVVIYGGSYGGYATLAGVTFTPELYAAGVDIVGPSNLITFLQTIPPYWESFRKQMDQRVGIVPRYSEGERAGEPKDEADWTAEDRAEVEFLKSRSPLFHVDNIRVPMLIAQGANDPRVVKAESDQFVEAMRANGLEVEYVVYEDEGHGFARPENRLDFYHRVDRFLARILGGRAEE